MTEETESEGKTVAEAVESALKKLGLHRDQVEVQILQEASPGILGFGAKSARVKITRKHWGTMAQPPQPEAGRAARGPRSNSRERSERGRPVQTRNEQRQHEPPARQGKNPVQRQEERGSPSGKGPRSSKEQAVPRAPSGKGPRSPEEQAVPRSPEGTARRHERPEAAPVDPAQACSATEEILKELLELMLFTEVSVAARWDAEQERVKTNVKTPEADRLIGPGGETLEAMQFLMTLMVSRRLGSPVAVQVDTGDFWQKKENEVLSQALKGIENVRNTGKPFRLQPMEAPMRRLIHKSLANHPDIMTASEGDGPWRKIVLRPRK